MNLPESTPKFILLRLMDRTVNQERSDWAIDLMKLGHNSESIILLAGISPPYDKFELRDLVDDVFRVCVFLTFWTFGSFLS
ncbi:MAG: hypothetical protein H6620_10485 [Halobacteriovoraceae bacterium]|nr:hypothetical protein [Halobacteriovoraceae bacterium]